ncbi:ferredoxin [Thermococci archaeon]|nr:MAG: ferredoxin [Thermococci archaeon]
MKNEEGYPEIPVIPVREIGSEPVAHWRVMKPVVKYEICKKCWVCVQYCPEGVIKESESGPIIDYRFCKGCGICANECPVKAIVMVREV